jgi:predicted  nucleic acid-binding Zn-ribbon protein
VEKKAAEERHALKQREKIVEEKEVDMQDKLSHIREKEEELARRNALLEE